MSEDATSLSELLQSAGWTMLPLYLCSLLALAMTVRKLAQFHLEQVGDRSALQWVQSLEGADLSELEAKCRQHTSPLAQVMATALQAVRAHPNRAEGAATRHAVAELDRLAQGLTLLAFIAQVAPLFGLLGTVLGMVDLFAGMEAAGEAVETSTLSSGIWKALLTTAAGLMIAIPTLGAHAWLSSRLDGLQLRMEEGAGRILDHVLGVGA